MNTKELRAKDAKDLEKLLYEKKEALRALRSNLSGSKSKNVKEVSAMRKDIARMLTEISGRKLKVESRK